MRSARISLNAQDQYFGRHFACLMWIAIFTLLANVAYADYDTKRMGISYSYPTTFSDWVNAYLAGNGKQGIIVLGNPLNETVIYNDRGFNMAADTSRSFAQVSAADVEQIRSLCVAGNFQQANSLALSSAQWHDGGEGNRHPGYKMTITIPASGTVTNYSRTCDFRTGEITVKWTDNRGNWERKAFVSRKDNATVQYLSKPTNGTLTCSIQLGTDPGMNLPSNWTFTNVSTSTSLNMRVLYNTNAEAGYEGVTRVVVVGGSSSMNGNILNISGATSVMMLTKTAKYLSNASSQWNQKLLQNQLATLSADYATLLAGQIATHQAIYDRVKIDLGASAVDRAKSNEQLLAMQKNSSVPVPALWERIFDAGRYYYLSSSSELTPPDLLGIWTGDCNVGWGGYYHLDANLNLQIAQGNIGDMPEAMEGYFHINEVWQTDFRINAQKLLRCRGMVAAGNTPGLTSGLIIVPNAFYTYQYATGEEPWLLYPFWEHYLITGDKTFLQNRVYPLLKDMGNFYEDFLTKIDSNGKYIFAGSISPETQPANLSVSLVNNSTFDISGARFALTALIETCNTLGVDQGPGEGVEKWTNLLNKLPNYRINSDGALAEWVWPGLDDVYNHRHSSQMLPLWPYREITPETDQTMFNAALTTLSKKDNYNYEDSGHGFLMSALVAANLNNTKAVTAKLLYLTKEDFYFNSLSSSHYSNHNIFCTDTSNTVPAVMMEMLVSSRPGVLELLPALPQALTKGSISGVKARNRVTVQNLAWDTTNQSVTCTLKSDIDQNLTLIQRQGINTISSSAGVGGSPLGSIARTIQLQAGVSTVIAIELGNSGAPTTIVPDIPTNLTAASGSGRTMLSWAPSLGATSYRLKRSTTSGGPYTSVANPTAGHYDDSGLSNGTTYYYVVSAVNSAGESGTSPQTNATPESPPPPSAPINLTATPYDGQVLLNWAISQDATSYKVKRSIASGGPYTTIASPSANSYANIGLTNGTAYYYVVSAVKDDSESVNSGQISATPTLSGGTLITPGIVAFSSEYNSSPYQRLAANLVNGAGMSGPGYSTNTHDDGDSDVWHHAPGDNSPYVIFDLGGTYDLTTTRIWNLNQAGNTQNGAKDVRISVSADNVKFTTLGTNTLARGGGTATEPAQNLSTPASGVRYVKIEPLTGYGGGWNGLSAVRFEGTTPPPPPPVVTVTATDATAQKATIDEGVITFTRSGITTTVLPVMFSIFTGAGQAVYGTDYSLTPTPSNITIPVGQSSAQLKITAIDRDTLTGPLPITVTIDTDSRYSIGTDASAMVQILDSPFHQWKIQQFGNVAAAQSPAAADTANPDKDAETNLMEYGLGHLPLVADVDAAGTSAVEDVGGASYLTYSFDRPKPAPGGITYTVETSPDLGSTWEPAVMLPGYPLDLGNTTERVKFRSAVSMNSKNAEFIRLRISRP